MAVYGLPNMGEEKVISSSAYTITIRKEFRIAPLPAKNYY